MKTEILTENFNRMCTENLYYKYYFSNLAQIKGIERKNRQLRVLKQRLADYETLRRWVKRYTKRDMSETDMVDFIANAVKFYTAHTESDLWCPPKPETQIEPTICP